MRKAAMAAALLCGLLARPALADTPAAQEGGTLSLLFENDVFFNTDRDYTNGVLLSYTLGPSLTPDWLSHAVKSLPRFGGDVRMNLELGQNIYTPTDISLPNPPLTDRPYAGFLYLGLGLVTDNADTQEQLQLQLGVVGPDSLAGETQTWIHSMFGYRKPRGWDTQLANEPALQLTYEASRRFGHGAGHAGFGLDVSPHAGIAVGNVYDYVNAGAMARIGFNLPDDYGPVRIDPSLPGSSFYGRPGGCEPWTVYLFGGLDGRVMGHNIFLDGNDFTRSRSVAKNVLVGDAQFGIALAYGPIRLSLTHVFRTKEYHTQPGVDQFGAVNLSIRF